MMMKRFVRKVVTLYDGKIINGRIYAPVQYTGANGDSIIINETPHYPLPKNAIQLTAMEYIAVLTPYISSWDPSRLSSLKLTLKDESFAPHAIGRGMWHALVRNIGGQAFYEWIVGVLKGNPPSNTPGVVWSAVIADPDDVEKVFNFLKVEIDWGRFFKGFQEAVKQKDRRWENEENNTH